MNKDWIEKLEKVCPRVGDEFCQGHLNDLEAFIESVIDEKLEEVAETVNKERWIEIGVSAKQNWLSVDRAVSLIRSFKSEETQ